MKKKVFLERLKMYGLSCCISYTIASLILSALNINSSLMEKDVWLANLQLFAVCLVIAVLMLITDTIRDPEEPTSQVTPGYFLIGILDVAVPVLGMGGFLFGWFDVISTQVIYPICILLIVYFAVFAIFYINKRNTEKELNRRINQRKEELKNDKQDN